MNTIVTRFFAVTGLLIYLVSSLQVPFYKHFCFDNLVSVMAYTSIPCGGMDTSQKSGSPIQNSEKEQLSERSCCSEELISSSSGSHLVSASIILDQIPVFTELFSAIPKTVLVYAGSNNFLPLLRPPPLDTSSFLALVQTYLI